MLTGQLVILARPEIPEIADRLAQRVPTVVTELRETPVIRETRETRDRPVTPARRDRTEPQEILV